MTDEEVICSFMEPRPLQWKTFPIEGTKPYPSWWQAMDGEGNWYPVIIEDLNVLHEVEEKLTDEQWNEYEKVAVKIIWESPDQNYLYLTPTKEFNRRLLNASAEQKIKALAIVLRK